MIKTSQCEHKWWKYGDVWRTGRAADNITIFYRVQNDTTRCFQVNKTRWTSPECINSFRIHITFAILRGKTCSRAYGKTALLLRNTGISMRVKLAFSKDRRYDARPSWNNRLCEAYGAWDRKVRLVNVMTSAIWVPRLLSEDNCEHNKAGYNCKHFRPHL